MKTPAAIVLLGMPRSGTTLLKEMLDHHPAVAIPPESYFIPSLWRRYGLRRDAQHLLGDLAALPQLKLWGVDLDEVGRQVKPGAGFADVIEALYRTYATARGKTRWGDKTPAYLENLGALGHAFPGAHYLHIIRDGRDAALSYQDMHSRSLRGPGFPQSIADFAWRWRTAIERARSLGASLGPDRYREVHYERLIAEPELVLRESCDFLGMDFDPGMLAYHRDRTRAAMPHHPRLSEPPSRGTRDWRKQMPGATIARFEALAGSMLSRSGYERSLPDPGTAAKLRASLDRFGSEARMAGGRAIAWLGPLTPFWRQHQARRFRHDDASHDGIEQVDAGRGHSPLRVLLYAIDFAPLIGGEERYLLRLAMALSPNDETPVVPGAGNSGGAQRRVAVTLLTRTPAGAYDDSALPFPVLRQPRLTTLWRQLGAADVVHTSGPVLLPLLLAYLRRKPTVVTHHMHHAACPNGLFYHHPSAGICPGHFEARRYSECVRCNTPPRGVWRSLADLLVTFPRRWLCRCADVNIAVSNASSRRLALPRSTTIYHGITPPPAEATVSESGAGTNDAGHATPVACFAYVGRLVPEKGVAQLVQAAAQVLAQGYDCGLKVIGGGPERASLEGLARNLGIEERVEFTGPLAGSDLPAVLDHVTAVVAPSICVETAGLVPIEHMARGGLVIVSDAGGLGEMVGDAGLTFPPGDVDALADCLRRVMDDSSLAPAYGHAASGRAERVFVGDRDIQAHRAAYVRLIARD